MAEKDTIFSSAMSYGGVFKFPEFYLFCYQWLTEELNLDLTEKAYKTTIKPNGKDVKIEWDAVRKVTDYFKFLFEIVFEIVAMSEVEVIENGQKVKANKGKIKLKIKGVLIKDYEGKFEKDALRKFLRGIYEKWVITSRVDEMETKLFGECDEFLNQAKAYLALEGKR